MKRLRQHYHSWLVPYVEGTLDAPRRRALEARLARDPQLAAEAEAQRQTAQRLREAAQPLVAPEASPDAESALWRRVQAQIEPPRRAATRPLVWAGSACALAGLAWAVVWGPLGHLTMPRRAQTRLPQVVVTPSQELPMWHETGGLHRHRLVRKARRPITLMVKRPASLHPSALHRETPATTDERRLAASGPTAPTAPDEGVSTPESGGSTRFRLAAHTHPSGQEADGNAPKSDAAPQTTDMSAVAPGSDAASALPATDDPKTATSPAQTPHSHRRRHRRHHRVISPAEPSNQSAPAVQTPGASPSAPDTSAPVRVAPRHPKPLPID